MQSFDDFDTQVQADEFDGFGFEFEDEDDELVEAVAFEDEEEAVAYWLGR